MARILLVHQNFPGQYRHLLLALIERGHDVVGLGMADFQPPRGMRYLRYGVRRGSTPDIHPWIVDFESKVIRGEACARAALELRDRHDFSPDLICVHPGWGEALFLRDVWPAARQLHYVEYFYGLEGQDTGFDPEFDDHGADTAWRLHIKNTNNLLNLVGMDHGISPTAWQRSLVPAQFHDRIAVIHDGIDTRVVCPDSAARLKAVDDRNKAVRLTSADEVITYCARNLEPMRGYHVFMRALPEILARRPNARVVIIGGADTSYGAAPAAGSWKTRFLNEVASQIDLDRVHFLGRVPYDVFLSALRISSAHVYLSYPFVLSWSLLEAMAVGAPLVAMATDPVREVVRHRETGVLIDEFSPDAAASAVVQVLADEGLRRYLSVEARQFVKSRFDLVDVVLARQLQLLDRLLQSGMR